VLQDAGGYRRDLGVDLVRHDLDQGLVAFDAVTHLLEPAANDALAD